MTDIQLMIIGLWKSYASGEFRIITRGGKKQYILSDWYDEYVFESVSDLMDSIIYDLKEWTK